MERKLNLRIEGISANELQGLIECVEAVNGTVAEIQLGEAPAPREKTLEELATEYMERPKRKRAHSTKRAKRFNRNTPLIYKRSIVVKPDSRIEAVQNAARRMKRFNAVELGEHIGEEWATSGDHTTSILGKLMDHDCVKVDLG